MMNEQQQVVITIWLGGFAAGVFFILAIYLVSIGLFMPALVVGVGLICLAAIVSLHIRRLAN